MRTNLSPVGLLFVAGVVLLSLAPRAVVAQESKSAALALELAKLLDGRKMDSISARVEGAADEFVAALYFSGQQFLVVSARYSVPPLLEEKIAKAEHRDVYIDLQSASQPASKFFVTDLNADGLKIREKDDEPFDLAEWGSKSFTFDNAWRRQQKMYEDDFAKAFSEADARYVQILTALLDQAKKTS